MSEAIQAQEYLAWNKHLLYLSKSEGNSTFNQRKFYRFSAQKLKKGRGVSNLKKLILMEGKI